MMERMFFDSHVCIYSCLSRDALKAELEANGR
jgi:hypothetical protein